LNAGTNRKENGLNDFFKYRLPAVLWMMFIFFLSSIPKQKLPDVDFPYVHMLAHFVEYTVLGFLLVRSFLHSVGSDKKVFAAAAAFIVALLFACSDEYHQTFVAGRNGDWMTVVYDAIFSVIGIGAFLLFLRRKH